MLKQKYSLSNRRSLFGSFVENKRGQFVIVAALVISVLTLSLALSINQINVNKEELSYEPINELLLGITSDMERVSNIALRDYTQAIVDGESPEVANEIGQDILNKWRQSTLMIYSPYEVVLNDPSNPDFDCSTWWSAPDTSMSRIVVSYNINVGSFGYEGWRGTVAKFVVLNIDSVESINVTSGEATINFSIFHSSTNPENQVPIIGLTSELIDVGYLEGEISTFQNTIKKNATINSLVYKGDGSYQLTFNRTMTVDTTGIFLTVETPDCHIYVSTYTILAPDQLGARIIINVIADGSDEYFDFNITSSLDERSFIVNETTPWNSGFIPTGDYLIESLHNELLWTLLSPENNYNVSIVAGETIAVTFTYSQPESLGQVYISKTTYTESLQNFTFTLSSAEFSETFDLSNGDNWDNEGIGLLPGVYTLFEELPEDWVQMAVRINGTLTPSSNNQIIINVVGNQTYIVDVVNAQAIEVSTISVEKQVTQVSSQSFDFMLLGPISYTEFFSLTGGTGWDSEYLSPGVYSIEEFVPAGWVISETKINDTASPTNNIIVEANNNYVVTFVNSPQSEVGDWSTLYLTKDQAKDKEKALVPFLFWDGSNGHDQSYSSQATSKEVSMFNSTEAPQITLAETITMTYYISAQPDNHRLIREFNTTLGFTYDGVFYQIGYCIFDLKGDQSIYVGTIDVEYADYGFGLRTIPAGSTFTVIHTVTFIQQPGFTFVYYGMDTPTRIQLY